MGELDDIVEEFLVESQENLDKLDQDFIALEENPDDSERLASVFRVIHTVKGTCGFLGFSKLESVTHVGENLLSKLRDGKLALNQDITNALLATVDAVREILNVIEATGSDGENDYAELVKTLTLLQEGKSASLSETKTEPKPEAKAPVVVEPEAKPEPQAASPEPSAPAPAAPSTPSAPAAGAPSDPAEPKDVKAAGSVAESSIRVDVHLLDKLMNLVGELVLTRNQVLQFGVGIEDVVFSAAIQRLSLITTELQEGVMKTRMQPIGNAWSKFPRVVRDLAQGVGKQVKLVMEGKETELDKSLIEAIRDPLTHMVRNSVDHGVEGPEEREKAGKPVEGTLTLHAYHEGGQVNIDIIDDGAGINTERVVAKAVEKGLISASDAQSLTDRELANLLFLPGLSTAEKVTNVSGRGVGMDVVKTNIERIGGSVDIQTQRGVGTTFKVRIPLTLAIVPALIVTSGSERYAIPQMSLLELVRLVGEEAETAVEFVGGAPVYRLRGKLLPLVYLSDVLQNPTEKSVEDTGRQDTNIVVLQAADQLFGLVVDQIQDSQEIVVKPLGRLLHSLSVYAGVTILGDGKVALILDVAELAGRSGMDSSSTRTQVDTEAKAEHGKEEMHQLLVFASADDSWMAVPLSQVTRLEKLPCCDLEFAGERCVIQYRGEIMQLIDVDQVLSGGAGGLRGKIEMLKSDEGKEDNSIDVVVYSAKGKNIGLMVDRIVDIAENSLQVQGEGGREGVISTIAHQDRVMEIIDINKVLSMADPSFFRKGSSS